LQSGEINSSGPIHLFSVRVAFPIGRQAAPVRLYQFDADLSVDVQIKSALPTAL